jgi:hypothetical protein
MKQRPRGRFTTEFKVEAVRLLKAALSILMTSKVLGVSTSGYYEHQRSLRKPRTSADRLIVAQLLVLIKSIHGE